MKIKRIYIEITNSCNLSCSFCAKHFRSHREMTSQEFEAILLQVKKITKYIYLHVQGEPLLHHNFSEILSLCDFYDMKVQLVTNATMLYQYQDLLSHTSLRKISFSLQSIEYQNKSMLKSYFNQLEKTIELASFLGHPYCELRFWRTDQNEMSITREYIHYLKTKYTFTPTKKKNSYRILPNVYVDFDNCFDWPVSKKHIDNINGYCHGAIHQIAILSNGEVVPCCLDYNGTISFGNIFQMSLLKILSSSRYRNMVNGFQEKKVVEPYCQNCTFRNRFF